MRLKATIAYDGSRFYGFQYQPDRPSVVSALHDALRTLHIETTIVGSGRTDRNVHATGQVVHFDVPDYWHDLTKLQTQLNRKFDAITVRRLDVASDTFHARFDAKARLYRYIFKTMPPSVFERRYVAYTAPFDTALLTRALHCFEGTHDFAMFCKTGSDTKTTVRTVYQTRYYRRGVYHIVSIEGNAFLRSQVRLMMAGAFGVAQGRLSLHQLQAQRDGKAVYLRKPAPPEGLYLARVYY